jgi:hypothetical protein
VLRRWAVAIDGESIVLVPPRTASAVSCDVLADMCMPGQRRCAPTTGGAHGPGVLHRRFDSSTSLTRNEFAGSDSARLLAAADEIALRTVTYHMSRSLTFDLSQICVASSVVGSASLVEA